MKRRGPSNVFTVPKWMTGLQTKAPEGTMTPDQVAQSLEMCILINDGDLTSLRNCIAGLTVKVPLKHQPFVRALGIGDVMANVQALISKSNEKLAQLPKEAPIEPRREEIPVCTGGSSDDAWSTNSGDWEDDSDIRRKPSTRGQRSLRAAKRQQAEAGD